MYYFNLYFFQLIIFTRLHLYVNLYFTINPHVPISEINLTSNVKQLGCELEIFKDNKPTTKNFACLQITA